MKKCVVSRKGRKHRFWHRMNVVSDNGHTVYKQCRSCETRAAFQPDEGHQPLNIDWLCGLTDLPPNACAQVTPEAEGRREPKPRSGLGVTCSTLLAGTPQEER